MNTPKLIHIGRGLSVVNNPALTNRVLILLMTMPLSDLGIEMEKVSKEAERKMFEEAERMFPLAEIKEKFQNEEPWNPTIRKSKKSKLDKRSKILKSKHHRT